MRQYLKSAPNVGTSAKPTPSRRRFSLARLIFWFATVDERDVQATDNKVLYLGIGTLVMLFGLYGCVAYYVLLAKVGLRHIGSPAIGTLTTALVALLVTVAVVTFDRTLVAQIDAELDSLPEDVSKIDAAVFLRPVGRRRMAPLIGRVCLALLIGVFATQTIELFVFQSAIKQSQAEGLKEQYELELTKARKKSAEDSENIEKEVDNREALIKAANSESSRGREGQHGNCAEGSVCENAKRRAESLTRENQTAEKEHRNEISAPDTKEIAALKAKLQRLRSNPDRVVAENAGVLQDVTALYPYLWKHWLSLVYYIMFAIVFLCVDLGAIVLKYTFAHKSEYEHDQAAKRRVRWLTTADQYRALFASSTVTPDEEAGMRSTAQGNRRAAADFEKHVRVAAYRSLEDDPAIVDAVTKRTRDEWIRGFDWGLGVPHPGVAIGSNRMSKDGRSVGDDGFSALTQRAEVVNGAFLLSMIGAIGGIVVVVYLLGGAYMIAQIKQASLPATALTYVSSRTLIRYGVMIGGCAVLLIVVLAVIVRPAAKRAAATFARSGIGVQGVVRAVKILWTQLLLRLRHPFSRVAHASDRANEAVRVTSWSATLAALAGLLGEWTDLGFAGGLETFGFIGAGLLFGGLLLLLLFSVFNPRSGLSRYATVLLVVASVALGAYRAGQIRTFRLPVATIHLNSRPSCREASFLGETSAGVYVVDGPAKKLEVVPWRTIANLSISPSDRDVVSRAARSFTCGANGA